MKAVKLVVGRESDKDQKKCVYIYNTRRIFHSDCFIGEFKFFLRSKAKSGNHRWYIKGINYEKNQKINVELYPGGKAQVEALALYQKISDKCFKLKYC